MTMTSTEHLFFSVGIACTFSSPAGGELSCLEAMRSKINNFHFSFSFFLPQPFSTALSVCTNTLRSKTIGAPSSPPLAVR